MRKFETYGLFVCCVFICFFVFSHTGCDCSPPPITDAGPVDEPPKLCVTTATEFSAEDNKKIFGLSPLPAMPANPTNKYADDPKAAHLGQFLFYDKRLSLTATGGGTISCETCHSPTNSWSDKRKLSKGLVELTRHSPTLWNVGYQRWMFWDGRADSIWAQAVKPIEDSKEMAGNRYRVMRLFAKEDANLKTAYEAIFGTLPVDLFDRYTFTDAKPMPDDTDNEMHKNWESISAADQELINRFYSNIGKAIEAFERKIISKDAPFDTFVDGYKNCDQKKVDTLSASAQRGLKIFVKKDSCVTCHDGPNFSDNEFHNIGLPPLPNVSPDVGRIGGLKKVLDDIFNGRGAFSDAKPDDKINDKINFLRTNNNNAFGEFKTPTLRHSEMSGPYHHDGRFETLKEVIKFYSHFGVEDTSTCIKDGRATHLPPKTDPNSKVQPKSCKLAPSTGLREETMLLLLLKDEEIEDVVNFLKSLTGQSLPQALLEQPASPILK